MKARWTLVILLATVSAALAGCTSSGPTASPTASIASPTSQATDQAATPTVLGASPTARATSNVSVTIKDFSFQPGEVTIAKGGTVTWTNGEGTAHTVKFTDSQSSTLQKGDMYSKKFDTAGSFGYACGIHPSMKGTVNVV